MGREWAYVPVSQTVKIQVGGTPNRAEKAYWNGDIKWIAAADVAACRSRYIYDTEQYITREGLQHSAAKLLPKDTIVITARGTVGALCMLGCDMAFNQTCYGLVAKDGYDPSFVYYGLRASLSEIISLSYGTVFNTITTKTFDALMIPNPPLPIQRRIAHILGTLDDKIAQAHAMNATLEAIARALFRSWFVDFDPVRAKADGRDPPGIDAATAALFPAAFEDSPLGKVPRGWRVGTVGDTMEFAYGRGLKEDKRRPGNIPVYGSNGVVGWHDEKLVDGPGIIVGRKGNPGTVKWSAKDFFPIDTTFYVIPKDRNQSMYYLYHALCWQDLTSLAADSAVPGLNRNLAYMNEILIPPSQLLEVFDNQVSALDARYQLNETHTRTLAALRDTLLPKLLSGEVGVGGERG
jgi:type I restriction enzyme, S subunit